MAAKAGKNWLLKRGDGGGSEVFAVIGGCRQVQFTMDSDYIDVTSQDSPDWKQGLSGSGLRNGKCSASGVSIVNDAVYTALRAAFLTGTIGNFQIVDVDDSETHSGAFKITSLEKSGEYKGEVTYSLSLESSGAITIS